MGTRTCGLGFRAIGIAVVVICVFGTVRADVPAGGAPVVVPAGTTPPSAASTAAPAGAGSAAPVAAGGAPPVVAGGAPPVAGGGAPPVPGGGVPGVAAGGSTSPAPTPVQSPAASPSTPPPEPVYENVPRRPQPAFMESLAAKRSMLDVVRAGSRLVAVGAHGDIVTSIDGGATWVQSPSPAREMLTAVAFADADHGWAVGYDAVILHTGDGGKTWQVQHFDPKAQAPLLNLYCVDAQHAVALGAFGSLLQTADGGKTWTDVSADNIRKAALNFYDLVRLGNGDLLMVGEQGMVGLSTDDGASWTKLKSPYVGSFFGALPAGANGALIFGLRGHVYYTSDIGSGSWQPVATHTIASLFGGALLKDGRFVLVGASGVILLIAADGSNVTAITGPSDHDYDAVLPVGAGLVLAGKQGMQRVKALP